MITRAVAKYVRMSPRKIRYVLDLVRRKEVPEAYSILDRTMRRPALAVRKLIQQAADSAQKQHQLRADSLYISKIFADGAGMLKRYRAMSMGRAGMIRKRLSHITVELDALASQPKDEPATPASTKEHKGRPLRRLGVGQTRETKRRKLAGAK